MQRRFDHETKRKILCDRVVRAYNLAQREARKEVQEPWFLLALLPTFPANGKSGPPEAVLAPEAVPAPERGTFPTPAIK